MKFIDAFSGIGGFHLGIKNVISTSECVLSIEVDKAASAVCKKNFGNGSSGDITKLTGFPDHDILLGGFPCQAFSTCGVWGRSKGRIIGDDDRANLFLYLAKILQEKQPKYFLFENVKGILSIKNKDGTSTFETILETFKDCGYNVQTHILDSADYGLAQQRKRVFFIGKRNDLGALNFNPPPKIKRTVCVRDVLMCADMSKYSIESIWGHRTCNMLPMTRLEALKLAYNSGKWKKPTKITGKITPLAIITNDTPSGVSRQHDRLYSDLGIATTLHTFTPAPFETPQGWRILTPRECARLQGFPDSFVLDFNNNNAYHQIGNAVSVPVVSAVLKELLDKQ